MYDIEQHMPEIRPEVPGCPDQQIERAILMAARDFCADTWVFQAEVTAGGIEIDWKDDPVLIYKPNGSNILGIARAMLDDEPTDFTWNGTDRVKVVGKGLLTVIAALQPNMRSDRLPDVLMRYEEPITAGAKYRLMRMPGVEWSSPDIASHYSQVYGQGVLRARVDQSRNNSANNQIVRSRSFIL